MTPDIPTALYDALAQIPGVTCSPSEPMARHTTYRVGGPASLYINVATLPALVAMMHLLKTHQAPWLVLGNGSNVLFSDSGFAGVVIHLDGDFDYLNVTRDTRGPGAHTLECGAAMSITRLLRKAKEDLLDGLSFLGGIPATIGGAVTMNAGTNAGEIKDSLDAVHLLVADDVTVATHHPGDPSQRPDCAALTRWVPADQLALGYRHCELPEGAIVLGARLRVSDGDESMRDTLDRVLEHRKRTQPLTMPSCGSVFANPPGDHAGRLIERCGLKGMAIGDAEVSRQHANWIVNTGNARAEDIRALISMCAKEVEIQQGVRLRHEVRMLGDWTSDRYPGEVS